MKINITVEITEQFYKTILEGTKLLEESICDKYGRKYKITEEYFLRNAVASYITELRDNSNTFNEN